MKKKLTFEEASEVSLDSIDRNAFSRLSNSRDFIRFRRIVEDYVLQLTHNIVIGTELEKGKRNEEMDKLVGFTKTWNRLMNLIDNEEHHKHEKPKE